MVRKDKPKGPTRMQIEIAAAIQDLVGRGLVVDSGQRRWSQRTQRYEIVWVSTGVSKKLH
jgi:hypothetical protein